MGYCNETLGNSSIIIEPGSFLQCGLGVVMALLIIFTVAGNILTIAAYIIDNQLRNVYNTYIFNLAITDLLIGLFSMPFWAYYTLNNFHWGLRSAFCKAWFTIDYTLCIESVLMILILSYDRFQLIRFGHRYEVKVTMKSARIRIVITWVVAFLAYGPVIIGWDTWYDCSIVEENMCNLEFALNSEFTIPAAIIAFFLPFKGLIIINGLLYCEIRRLIVKSAKADTEVAGLTEDNTSDTLADQLDQNDVTQPTSIKESTKPPSSAPIVERINCSDTETVEPDESGATFKKKIINEDDIVPAVTPASDRNNESNTEEKDTEKEECNIKRTHSDKRSKSVDIVTLKTNLDEESNIMADDDIKDGPERRKVISDKQTDDVSKTHTRSKSDTTEAETSDILVSVLGVMEKHGSGILDLESDEENPSQKAVAKGHEDVTDKETRKNSNEESKATIKLRPELTHSLRRKISNYASRIIHSKRSVETVGLEKFKDDTLFNAEQNDFENETYEERDIDLAVRQHQESVLRKRKESTQSSVSRRRRNSKAAKFLAMLVLVFLVTWAPYTIATIIEAVCPKGIKYACVNQIVYETLTWLLWTKSAINPFLYAYNSSRYRQNFVRFLSCCWRR